MSVRGISRVDVTLLVVVLMWSLNITVSKYLLQHGWKPLTYGVLRIFFAVVLFTAVTLARERSLRIARSDLPLVGLAAVAIFLNQYVFVYAVELTTASTVALILATTPAFVGLFALAAGLGLPRAFWPSVAVTFVGVFLVAAVGQGGLSGNVKGNLLALAVPCTWAAYSMAIAPLMQRYSAIRLSSVILGLGWLPLAAVGASHVAAQSYSFGAPTWLGFAYAVVGPLFLTNILWFNAIDKVGAARATVFQNSQPFFSVVFAVVLLSEHLYPLQIVGGALIFAGIALVRLRGRVPSQPIE